MLIAGKSKQFGSSKNIGVLFLFIFMFILLLNTAYAANSSDPNNENILSEPSLISNLLVELASITKTNYDKIKTMEGKIEFSNLNIYDANDIKYEITNSKVDLPFTSTKVGVVYEGVTSFKSDAKARETWTHLVRPKMKMYKDMLTNKTYDVNGIVDVIQIVGPNTIIKSEPYLRKKDGTVLENRAIKNKRSEKEIVGIFNWGDYTFFYKPVGFTWEYLLRLKELLTSGRLPISAIVVKENKEGYFLKVESPKTNGDGSNIYRIKFPVNTGFNPTLIEKFDASEKIILERFILDYKEIKGLFVPYYINQIKYDTNGNIIQERKHAIKDIKVNETIPESTFTESNLGLKEGDKLIDKRDKSNERTFIYKKGEFVDIAKSASENEKIASMAGDANAILEIALTTPTLPATLKVGTRLKVEIIYALPENIDKVNIWIRPYINSAPAPGYRMSPGKFINKNSSAGEGKIADWFWCSFDHPISIDEIRLFMADRSGKEIITKSVPVSAKWTE